LVSFKPGNHDKIVKNIVGG
jgi:hypothetical protein